MKCKRRVKRQAGRGIITIHGVPIYSHQHGRGLGNVLRPFFRSIFPIFKKGAKFLGKEALRTGVDVARDVMSGLPVKQSIKRRSKERGRDIWKRAVKRASSPDIFTRSWKQKHD